jgi:hypothetical protein
MSFAETLSFSKKIMRKATLFDPTFMLAGQAIAVSTRTGTTGDITYY